MTFSSPFFLMALAPFGALVLHLLRGGRVRTLVPFLNLWKGPIRPKPVSRALRPPPLHVSLLLAAILTGILAAGGLAIRSARPMRAGAITLVVDRGLSMSARGEAAHRYIDAARQATDILNSLPPGPVDLISIPGKEAMRIDSDSIVNRCGELLPTALDTRAPIHSKLSQLLADPAAVVILLSDFDPKIASDRLIRITPTRPMVNVAITQIAARSSPLPQLLVRVRNDSPQQRASLAIEVDQKPFKTIQIELPTAPAERDYFVDLPASASTVSVHIDPADDLDLDNHAYLVRHQTWPRIEARGPIPPEVARMIEVYQRLQPASAESKRLLVGTESDPPGDVAAILIAPASEALAPDAALTITPHPVTRALGTAELASVLKSARIAPRGPDATWTTLIRAGDKTLVAIRDGPARQAWLGIAGETWASSEQFVILWTNLFNYVGAGGDEFSTQKPAALPGFRRIWPSDPVKEPGLLPGVYQATDGSLRAVSALPTGLKPAPADQAGVAEKLRKLLENEDLRPQLYSITPHLLLAALFLTVLATLLWRPIEAVESARAQSRNSPQTLTSPSSSPVPETPASPPPTPHP